MPSNVFQGTKVKLRAIEPDDWPAFLAMDQDTEVARASHLIPFPRNKEQYKEWAETQAARKPEGDEVFLVIETLAGQVVGCLNTFRCDLRMGIFSYGLALGSDFWRQRYGSDAINILLRYYFGELRYQKCTVFVYSFNEASIKLHEKLGFQPEGRLRRMIFTNGAYHDEIVLGITAEEFSTR